MYLDLDTAPICNFDSILVSVDIDDRIADLETLKGTAKTAEVTSELASLKVLRAETKHHIGDFWDQGAELIRDSHFTDYIMEWADDTKQYDFSSRLAWPFRHIDWDKAAKEIQQGYTEIDFDGICYWVES